MSTRVYLASSEAESGKSAIALGLLTALLGEAGRVGVFRPVVADGDEPDGVLELLGSRLGSSAAAAAGVSYATLHHDPVAAMEEIVERFHALAATVDTVLIVGSDYSDVPSPNEFAFNTTLAAHLDAPVLLVVSGTYRTPAEIATVTEVALADGTAHHAQVLAVVVNRSPGDVGAVIAAVSAVAPGLPVFAVPDVALLRAPTVRDLQAAVNGTMLYGDPARLDDEAVGLVVAAMTMPHVLDRLQPGGAVIAPADREDVLLAMLLAHGSRTFPSPAGLFLNGGFELSPQVARLVEGLAPTLPVIACAGGTMSTAAKLANVKGRLDATSLRKIDAAARIFAANVDARLLLDRLGATSPGAVTPLMFEQQLMSRARAANAHIVLPEGNDDRILDAAARIMDRGVARLTILGDPKEIAARAERLGLALGDSILLSPNDPEHVERYAERYQQLRAHKGVTMEMARDIVTDVSYFGTMMVLLGEADGMVSGACHTTAHTIRPALEVVKTLENVSVVSSVFLMCLSDQVLVYGDCAVNPDPSAEQLADIALSSAATAAAFGIEPRVAMLSYSTGASGTGADVDKVRLATELLRVRAPHLPVEGPIQYDAAVDAAVAATKLKGSAVAGHATVLIFPDLNTGNNTYKAVQRSAGAVAIGPVLQGLRRPVNDLSRGALVRDIVNTIAITAIQARVP